MNSNSDNISKSGIPCVDKEQLRYGVEMMRAAMGRARWLSINYANGRSVNAYRQIDRELCDLMELMDKHDWDLKSLFTEAAKPGVQNSSGLENTIAVSQESDWLEAVQKAYETLHPRKSFKDHLLLQRSAK